MLLNKNKTKIKSLNFPTSLALLFRILNKKLTDLKNSKHIYTTDYILLRRVSVKRKGLLIRKNLAICNHPGNKDFSRNRGFL